MEIGMKTFKEISETSEFQIALKKWHKEMRKLDYHAYSCNILMNELEEVDIQDDVVIREYHQFAIKKGLADKNSHRDFASTRSNPPACAWGCGRRSV